MKHLLVLFLFLGLSLNTAFAQDDEPIVGGTQWGFKAGGTLGTQRGLGGNQPLIRYHGVAFLESGGNENSSLYMALGYHARGSAQRGFFNNGTNSIRFHQNHVFHNVGLSLGVKKKSDYRNDAKYFYSFAMRGEWTVKTNLPYVDLDDPSKSTGSGYFSLLDNYVRRLNWGMDIGGGFEKKLSELTVGFIEFTISPDLSRQYRLIGGLTYRDFLGNIQTLPSQEARNLSIELSVGIRFWHKVIYE